MYVTLNTINGVILYHNVNTHCKLTNVCILCSRLSHRISDFFKQKICDQNIHTRTRSSWNGKIYYYAASYFKQSCAVVTAHNFNMGRIATLRLVTGTQVCGSVVLSKIEN